MGESATVIKSLDYVKRHTEEALASVVETRRPMLVTFGGEAKPIIQDVESYEETREALAFLRLAALGQRAVEQGDFEPAARVFEKIERRRAGDG
ncbi:MAG: hypothetical protein AB1578_07130 [Thermodesulfobacteriota bacterium]|jgi:PHD/YefM family antitoxin component YafN of YafNO toxin-antitoxin module